MMRSPRLMRTLGYAGFSVASLLFFFYFTFPGHAVGQRLEYEIGRLTKNKVRATFEDVSLFRLTGVEADKVRLQLAREQGDPIVLDLDSLRVRLKLLPLFLLRLGGSATLEAGDGSLDVDIVKKGDAIDFDLELDELSTPLQKLLSQLTGLEVRTAIDGDLESSFGFSEPKAPAAAPPGSPARKTATTAAGGGGGGSAGGGGRFAPDRSNGEGRLSLRGTSIGPGTVAGFTIPAPVSFGDIQLQLELKSGRLRIASFQQKGGQVALDISGATSLRADPGASTLESCIKFKFTDDAYLAKYPKVATALQLLSVRLQKDGEGFYNAQLAGTLSKPKPQRGLCRSTSRAGPKPPPSAKR